MYRIHSMPLEYDQYSARFTLQFFTKIQGVSSICFSLAETLKTISSL